MRNISVWSLSLVCMETQLMIKMEIPNKREKLISTQVTENTEGDSCLESACFVSVFGACFESVLAILHENTSEHVRDSDSFSWSLWSMGQDRVGQGMENNAEERSPLKLIETPLQATRVNAKTTLWVCRRDHHSNSVKFMFLEMIRFCWWFQYSISRYFCSLSADNVIETK